VLVANRIMWQKRNTRERRGFSLEFWSRRRVERAYWRVLEIERAEKEAAEEGRLLSHSP
jgi:hypothetical protein